MAVVLSADGQCLIGPQMTLVAFQPLSAGQVGSTGRYNTARSSDTVIEVSDLTLDDACASLLAHDKYLLVPVIPSIFSSHNKLVS
jgi:hypothetical protein